MVNWLRPPYKQEKVVKRKEYDDNSLTEEVLAAIAHNLATGAETTPDEKDLLRGSLENSFLNPEIVDDPKLFAGSLLNLADGWEEKVADAHLDKGDGHTVFTTFSSGNLALGKGERNKRGK